MNATGTGPSSLDHLVYGVPDLIEGVARVRELTGLDPMPGGRHERQATANYLLGLGPDRYLEIIGPDPDREHPPSWFGLDRLRRPRLLTWAVRATEIDIVAAAARATGYDPGPVMTMSRRSSSGEQLSWRLTPDTVEATGGVVPFLIDWGESRHPAAQTLPQLELARFAVATPRAERTRDQLAALGVRVAVEPAAEPGLRCILGTPRGPLTLH